MRHRKPDKVQQKARKKAIERATWGVIKAHFLRQEANPQWIAELIPRLSQQGVLDEHRKRRPGTEIRTVCR